MLILGLSGGLDLVHENHYELPYDFAHDSAAVLLDDGRVVAAIEEERLNRLKHTNKAAMLAARRCLDDYGTHPDDVELYCYYATERYFDRMVESYERRNLDWERSPSGRSVLARMIEKGLGTAIDPAKVHYVDHHTTHAVSAYFHSGFDDALVLTIDGEGQGIAVKVLSASDGNLEELRRIYQSHSLGILYRKVIQFIGYDIFDEYKVMGLAPYGDAERFRAAMSGLYQLLPEGGYRLFLGNVVALDAVVEPRRKWESFRQHHKDLAAALQETLEKIVLHLLTHYRQATGHTRLCLAGGVAHNSTLNGKILYSGLFDEVFAHPAAHDAGCALGAALQGYLSRRPQRRPEPLRHVFYGSDLGSDAQIREVLEAWRPLLRYERMEDPFRQVARRLADGAVVGWVQGRSEFGPRALGNRSILADPRPEENKHRINRMIKNREGYRPFAPSVLEERAAEFFRVPDNRTGFPYMIFVLDVSEDKRELLGAVTHVDGTARIQTVSRQTNERYWRLIREFDKLTGVPILLNTSFNNNAEPIVDSLQDAIGCYLTTDLDYIVAGDYLVTRRGPVDEGCPAMTLVLLPAVAIREVERAVAADRRTVSHEVFFDFDHGKVARVSPSTYAVLSAADGKRSIDTLLKALGPSSEPVAVIQELLDLWARRMIRLQPSASSEESS
jgi:carbamoyltransferase